MNFETREAIGVLTLNRPERMNAINYQMRDELRDFFMSRLNDTQTRVIVITGAAVGAGFSIAMAGGSRSKNWSDRGRPE